jgi:hypothetical protein
MFSIALALGILCLGAAPAHADQADQHYKRALRYYETKDYPRAIKELQAAYHSRQLPKILLNIGQVYRKLGMASTALKFYEHYLRVEPNPKPEIKAEVDRYIAQTRAMLDPPEFVNPPTNNMSAAEAAAAAVAAAPSNVTPVTVPELYSDDDLPSLTSVGQREGAGKTRGKRSPSDEGTPETPVAPPVVLMPPQNPPPPSTALPLVPGNPELVQPPRPRSSPFYKQPWFWGLVGGVAGAAIITGIAVGAQRANSLPPDILYPTK